MDLQEVLAALKKGENGDAMAAVIEGEMSRLAGEAGRYRRSNRDASEKVKNLLEAFGLRDGDDVIDQAKSMKESLDAFAQGGKKPTEVARQIADLTKQVTTLTNNYNEMTKTAEAERAKRLDAMKLSVAVDALTKGNAASPKDMARLIMDNIAVGDDESISYADGDNSVSVDDGVKGWLAQNTWAVKAMRLDAMKNNGNFFFVFLV